MILEMVGLFVLLLIFGLGFIIIYGDLIKLQNRVENAWALLDMQLTKRNDLIPDIVETVKNYAEPGSTLIGDVTKARAALSSTKRITEMGQASLALSSALWSLFAEMEKYPELKENPKFLQLQKELVRTEVKIAYNSEFYNDVVMKYNSGIRTIPNNIVASIKGFEEKELFGAPDAEKGVHEANF